MLKVFEKYLCQKMLGKYVSPPHPGRTHYHQADKSLRLRLSQFSLRLCRSLNLSLNNVICHSGSFLSTLQHYNYRFRQSADKTAVILQTRCLGFDDMILRSFDANLNLTKLLSFVVKMKNCVSHFVVISKIFDTGTEPSL